MELEGFTPLEIRALAGMVTERMEEVTQNNKGVGDSSKLALLTAIALAGDLSRAKEIHANNLRLWESKLEQMTQALEASLENADKNG